MCLAIPGQIVEFCDPERFLARVDVAGVRRVVNVALVSGGPDGVRDRRLGADPRRLRHLASRRAGGARDAPPARADGTRVRAGARGAERERNRVKSRCDRGKGCFTCIDIATAGPRADVDETQGLALCGDGSERLRFRTSPRRPRRRPEKTTTSSRASDIPTSTSPPADLRGARDAGRDVPGGVRDRPHQRSDLEVAAMIDDHEPRIARRRQIEPGRHRLYCVPIAERSWLSTAGVEPDASPPIGREASAADGQERMTR